MALKDCKFFADINGRQVEMDFDEFRAYLLQDNVMATLAPDLTGKRGKKAGFTLTAQKAETTAVKTEESKDGVYPFTEHKKAVQVINSFEEGEIISNGTILALRFAVSPKALSRIKSAEKSKLRPVSLARIDTWANSFVKNAQEKASIAGVWRFNEQISIALLQAENVIVPVDADQLKALYNLVQFDGVKVDYRDIANAVIVTKNGQPVGAISPFNMKVMEREHQITPETLRDVLKKPQSKAPVVPVKAKAVTTKAEAAATKAEAPSGNVVTVTAEPADAQRIADSVKTQKPDAQGFTKPQRTYLVEKAKEVYKEAQEASKSTKFVIKVPGDGQFTVKTPTEANSLHRRLTGDNVPGVDAKDTKVKREVLNPTKKTGLVETVAIGKAGDMKTPAFRWALQATAPSPARSKPFSRGLFTAKDKEGEFETKGSGAYPIELHEGSTTVENILPSGDYITDGYIMVLRSAVTPAGLKKVKLDTSRKNTPNLEGVKHAWDKSVKDASVPAEIAGVFQSEAEKGVALIDGPKGIIALNPDLVKSVLDLVKPDGVMVTPDSVEEAVIFTKNGKPVGAVQPFRQSFYKEDELEAALAFTKQESTSRPTLPLSAESLRKVQPSLSKDRAEALIQVLKAMGLPFDRIKLAKGEAGGKGTLKQGRKRQQAALDASPSAEVREAAKKWAGVKEIKPAVNSQLSALVNELEQLRGNIERSLYKKSIDELIAMDPIMQMSFGSQDAYPVQMHGRLKAAIVGYYSHLFVEPTSEFAYNHYSEQWGVPKADLVRQADITTLIYPNQDPFVKEEVEQRSGISRKNLLERGREAFKTGQPVLVETYHGSGASGIQGNRFNASLAGKTTGAGSAQRGYFFAGSKYTAESYLGQAAYALDPANYTNLTQGILYKFFVKMSNPFVYDMKGNEWREETFASIMDRAKAAGHDGVIFTNTYDGGGLDNIFTLFHGHENQIKSANPNTYDDQGKLISKSERFQAETPDIRYQKGKKPKAVTAITGMTPQEAVEYFKKAKLVRPELAREILSKDVPEHLKPVTEFIFRQRQKFLDGKMTVRDVAKAYIITVSSIQAGAIGVDAIKASTGQTFPEYATMRGKTGDIQIRPEDAVSAWLLTPDGKKALDSLEQTGKVDEKLWQPLIDLRQAYGNNTLKTWAFSPKSKGVNLYKIEEMTRLINQTGGNPRKLEGAVQRLVGIKDAKAGFIKHLLGFGDTPTVDAREINFWLTGQADISSLKTKGAEVARAAKDAGGKVRKYVVKRIGNQIKDLAKRYDMDVNVGAHIVHHWLWDATSNEVTTHAVMMDAMELAQTAYHATRGLFAPEPGFPNGRFRLDKVNTGLGAQSFGHGIYIAEGKAGVTAYTEMLEEDAPGSVVYELDVPDGIVAKLAIYEKPLTLNQFAALKSQVQSTLGEKGSQAIAGLGKANAGDLIERIQDAIDGEDAGRQTSEIFSKAGIPGVKVEVSKDFGENKSFYVIWNQAALDRIALMKANEEPLQTALEPIKQEEEAPPLGSIEFIDDLNAVISTFEGSNESTILHEGFHFYRRHMLNEANGFTRAEINEFNDWAGAKDGVWTVPAEEKAARGFEKYLRTGLAPTPELKKLFQKVAKWLREVYKTLQGSEIDIEIPDNIRRIFDRIFTLEAERQKGATGTVQAETSARTLQQSNVKARDAEYMAAVKAGNTAKAQKMVDAAANAAGYNTPKLYHGTPSRFNVFDASRIGINGRMLGPGFYFTTDKDTALGYTGQGGRVVTAYARSKKPLPYSSKPFNASQMQKLLTSIALIEANSEPGGNWRDGFLSGYVYTYGVSLEAAVKEASRAFLNEEKALDQLGGIIGSGADPANVNQGLKASLGYDSYTATGYENRGFGGGDIYVLMESEQVKSADPITYDDKGNVIPLSKRFEPSTPDIRYQKASTGPARLKQEKGKGAPGEPSATDVFRQKQAEARRKAAEAAMNRLRQATKEGQAKQASPASTTTTPPPKAAPSQPKAPKPSPSRPSTAGASTGASGQAGTSKPKVRKTIEQEVKDAIDRARKGKANPNNLPLDERLQRSIRGFADRFARRMVEAEAANIYQPDITLPDGSVVDRQERFEDSLHDYAKAFLANDVDGVTKMRAVLEKILPERPPKPKVQKTAAERIKAAIERAERAANRKAASLTVEERIDREVKAFADRFAKRMVWAKKAGTYTDDVILPDGTVVDRQTFFEQAVNDFMTAYQAGNMAGVSLAKSHMNMATEQVPPDVGFGIHSLRSPLSYSNVVGSYEGVMGPLGAEVSTAFKRFHQEVALKQKTMGEALAVLRKVMRENYFPAMRDAGFYGMESIVTSHIDYIQAINNFSQNYRKVQESARLFKNPSKFVKSRLEFAKQANMISGAPQSNGWPMAASFMKAAVYLTKLKFNPKSALMNYSQVFLSAGPYFSPVELVAIIGKSHRPSVRNRVIDGMRLVDVAVRTTGGREVDEGPRKTVWDYLDIFRYSSEQTRVIGYLLGEAMADRIAADRAAKKDPPLLAPQRQEIIRDWIEKIEFDNSPWNVAPFFRERGLKGALFQFKPFVQKNVERLYADIRRNPLDYVSPKSGNAFGKAIEKAFPESVRKYTKLIGYQVVIGGVGSVLTAIPVAKPIAGYLIYAGLLALAKSFGDDEEAEKAADAIYYGAPALVGVDLSNSVGYVETPHGKNIYEQLVNEFLGPAVSTTANIATQGAELYAEMNKPTPLGRPEQKAAKVERRVWDIAKAVTPTARPVEMAVTMARGKQPELYLDKPTPLTRGEKIGRFAAFNPLRQSKFFDQKEAADWQKRLAGKVTENPEIKRLEGEPDAKYARRQKMYQSWKPYYTRRMLSEPDFRLLSQEDKDAVLDNLKRNMVEETTKVSPDTDKFDAEEIIKRRLKRRQVED